MDRIFNATTESMFSPLFDHSFSDFGSEIIEKDGKKHVQLLFDVSAFKPEEIEIKTKDGKEIEVHAKHEGSSESGGQLKREYNRKCSIPANVDVNELKSMLSPDGVL